MENRINELEVQVSMLREQVKALQIENMYMQQQIDDNCIYIKQEEKSKILA